MTGPFALYKWEAAFKDYHIFLEGFLMTLKVGLLALVFALILGIFFGVFSASNSKVLKTISRFYVELIQNTPLVIQIFFIYNGLPFIGIKLDIFTIGMLGIGLYHGAYASEVIRAGIQSINKGQLEAGLSQGFTYWQTMRYIILPQATIVALPPLTNLIGTLIKNTSVLAMIAGGDLMYMSDTWSSNNMYYGPAYVITGALYFVICYPLTAIAKSFEKRFNKKSKNVENETLEERITEEVEAGV